MARHSKEALLDETKSRLGKLLASEDIRIEHRQVSGPFFDVKSRTLVLPIWKDMDADLYDLMIGHEVGHALFTPTEGWETEVRRKGSSYKGFLNLVEDARIEKKMKRLYPGLRKPMYNGYTQLVDRGFFSVPMHEMKYLPFADRLNVFFKLGVRADVQFNDKEQEFIARVEAAETFDEVMDLASELMEMAKEERERLTDMFSDVDFENDEDEVHDQMSDILDGDSAEGEDSDAEDAGEGTSNSSAKSSDEVVDKGAAGENDFEKGADEETINTNYEKANHGAPGGQKITQQLTDALKSFIDEGAPITEESLREKQRELIDVNSYPITYVKMPAIRLKDWVVPAETIHKLMRFDANTDAVREKTYTEFMNTNKSYISYLVKEFELRRNAKQFAKVRVSKTGELDLDKVWGYKFTENLFLQSSIVPQGKNHGMLMVIDMSSSMNDNIAGTLEQVVALTMFCRKVNIPFEVYGFNDNNNHRVEFAPAGVDTERSYIHRRNDTREGVLGISNNAFRLQQYLHSRMPLSQFNAAVKNLLLVAKAYKNYSYRYYSTTSTYYTVPPAMQMSGTPLNEACLVLRAVADEFKRKTKVEILNTIVLTDGDASYGLTYYSEGAEKSLGYGAGRVVIEDEKTHCKTLINSSSHMTQGLLEMYQKVTGSRVIGIYLMSGNNYRTQISDMMYKYAGRNYDYDEFVKQYDAEFKKHKFFGIKAQGYDVYYMVPGGELEIKETTMSSVLRPTSKGPTKNDLLKAFKKMQNTKQISRVFLNQFVQYVS